MIKQFFLICFVSLYTGISVSEVRELYQECANSKENALNFYATLEGVKENDKLIISSYKAAAMALKSKYEKGIKNKKRLFKQGVLLLEKNISKAPNNIELRLIRLSIQENTPKLLQYKQNILEDKNFLYNELRQVNNKNLHSYIKTFILQSKSFTKEEKSIISKL